ncbi:MAG: tyrosine-type recombinase/integrase [Betaproteobacteria bacterium]|nr:tyrosine-type recombinase/integrase [Betaproteobacteria bacterium]
MASVIKIGDKWRAQVRRKDHKPQTKTFRTKREADEWARGLESRIDADAEPKAAALMKVGDLIREYRQVREESGRGIDPTTNTSYMLNHLDEDLGHESVTALTPARLVQWASRRKAEGAGPWTVNQELSALGTMLRHAASFANLQLPDVTGQARPLLTHLQLIGAGARRTRRPTEDELQAVLAYVEARSKPTADAMRVAAVTGLRRSELVLKLKWNEIDEARRAVLIRQRKHPRRIEARDEWVPLLGDSWDIVQRQPKINDRVFPVSPEKISDLFTAATRACGIPDLRLHDLRHLASSRLQELGFDESERMAITGHRSATMNQRYTHPTPEHLHAKFTAATTPAPKPRSRRKVKTAEVAS